MAGNTLDIERYTGEAGGLPAILQNAGIEHYNDQQLQVVNKYGSAVLERVSTGLNERDPDEELARRMLPGVLATLAGLGEDPKLAEVLAGEEADETDEDLTELLAEAARLGITEVRDLDHDRASDIRRLGLESEETVESAKKRLRFLIAQERATREDLPEDGFNYDDEENDMEEYPDPEDHDDEDGEDSEYDDDDDEVDTYSGRRIEF